MNEQESNKIIAEFMGKDDLYKGMSDARAKRIYKYHTSWDWLMPVVQKCFDTQQPEEGQHYFINESLLTMDIGVVYDRVVEFINQYNKTK